MSEKSRYSVVVSTEDGVHNRVAGTREYCENMLAMSGAPYRWSEAAKDFIPLSKMNPVHLVNAIKEDIMFVNNPIELTAFLKSPILKEFWNRVNSNILVESE